MRWPKWLTNRLRPKTLGERGEFCAARYLRRQGYRIVAERDRSRIGEMDLVAVDDQTLVFVEVKTRRSTDKGHPADAVDAEKQRRITRAALVFLKAHGLLEQKTRFDVVGVLWPATAPAPIITHYKNAFEAVGHSTFFS